MSSKRSLESSEDSPKRSKWRKLDFPRGEGKERYGDPPEFSIRNCVVCAQTVDIQWSEHLGSCWNCCSDDEHLCSKCTHDSKRKYGVAGDSQHSLLPRDFWELKHLFEDYPQLKDATYGLVKWTKDYSGFGKPFGCDRCSHPLVKRNKELEAQVKNLKKQLRDFKKKSMWKNVVQN